MKERYSSRERMLMALENGRSDYIPCNFMIFSALADKCKDQYEFVQKQLELGLDVRIELPALPFRFHPEVKVREWKEKRGRKYLLHKEYQTPFGKLTTIVRKTEDWPYGNSVPLFNDYLVPRSQKFLFEKKEDLEPLRCLFAEPSAEDISSFHQKAKNLKRFAADKGLLVSGGWVYSTPEKLNRDAGTMGADALMWLCGVEKTLLLAMDEPETIKELLQVVSKWNNKRTQVYLEQGIDLLIKRAWYESTELWSPSLYHKFIFPVLKEEIELVHQAGTKFGYIMTSGMMPLLDDFLELGIDVLIGVDPLQGKRTDLRLLKEKLEGKICLWGGINGCLTIERGKEKEVEDAVEESISILGPEGFILSPVDNITDNSARTWNNVKTMIKTWKRKLKETE
jgi:uroporphyrinogen-III decarboxylase